MCYVIYEINSGSIISVSKSGNLCFRNFDSEVESYDTYL